MRKNYIQNGFALLYSIIVVSAMMSLVFGVLNIVYKQIALSGVNQDSTKTFYAASSGLECGQYWSTYGAFNIDNPDNPSSSNPFSTIQCFDTPLSNNPYLLSSDTIANTIANFVSGTPYYSQFTYPLGAMYSGSSINISSTVQVLQNTQFTPDPTQTKDITTEILSAGVTGNNPNQVQRGVGETAAISQCLAPAFTYTVSSSYPSWNSSNPSVLPSTIRPYFPGLSISGLQTDFYTTIGSKTQNQSNTNFLQYITYLPPDNWQFAPPNVAGLSPAPSLTLSANDLYLSSSFPVGDEYKFGYYASSSPTGGAPSAEKAFVPIYDSSATLQQPVSIPANTSSIHFALEVIDSSGNITDFWSTYFAQNAEDTGTDHVLVIATPIPTTINTNPNNQYTRVSGKYIFGFDTATPLPSPPTYDGVIIALQLAGCP